MIQEVVLPVSSILLYSALIATYSVGYVRDDQIRSVYNIYDQDYVNGLSATTLGSHIIGGLSILMYYFRRNTLFLAIAGVLFTIAFFFNLKLLEVPYDDNGVKIMQIDWLSDVYPVVWRLSSFILSIVFYATLFYLLSDMKHTDSQVSKKKYQLSR